MRTTHIPYHGNLSERSVSLQNTMAKDHVPLTYNVVRPQHLSKLEERQYVKERLALAYRVLAHERLCKHFRYLIFGAEANQRGEGASGHLTSRDPVDTDCFWVSDRYCSVLLD
jgi:hypothetical protein